MAEYRGKLLDSLKQILNKSPGTRIYLAGRFHIRDEVEERLVGRVAAVSITPTKDDIIRFLQAKLREDTTPDEMDKSLEEGIIKKYSGNSIRNVSRGQERRKKYLKLRTDRPMSRFLLVSLNIKAILQETTLHRRREKLGAITNGMGLEDAYDATIGRIKAQQGDRARLGIKTLMWVSHLRVPLNVNEIRHALAVEIGSTNINTNNVP